MSPLECLPFERPVGLMGLMVLCKLRNLFSVTFMVNGFGHEHKSTKNEKATRLTSSSEKLVSTIMIHCTRRVQVCQLLIFLCITLYFVLFWWLFTTICNSIQYIESLCLDITVLLKQNYNEILKKKKNIFSLLLVNYWGHLNQTNLNWFLWLGRKIKVSHADGDIELLD